MGDVIAPTAELARQVLEGVLAEAHELRPLAVHRHQLRATGYSCALCFDVDSKDAVDAAAMVAMEAGIGRVTQANQSPENPGRFTLAGVQRYRQRSAGPYSATFLLDQSGSTQY